MRISIVTPSYNQAAFLEETIRSVVDQHYSDLEYLVLDGGSTDGSREIIERHQKHLAYWVSEKDHGQADAIQKGLLRATGEIFAWQNSDDRYLPGTLAFVNSVFEENPGVDLLFGAWNFIDEQGRRMGTRSYHPVTCRRLRSGLWVPPQPAVFMRRSAVLAAGGINIARAQVMDYDLYLRMVRKDNVCSTARVLGDFRLHANSKTVSTYRAQYREICATRRELARDAGWDERLLWAYFHYYLAFREWIHAKTGIFSIRQWIGLRSVSKKENI